MVELDSSSIIVRRVRPQEFETISSILTEAAQWLDEIGEKLWEKRDVTGDKIRLDLEGGIYRIAEIGGEAVGCVRYQETDPEYWDDIPHEDSAFIHRVAVRRAYAGRGIPQAMIEWAKKKAKSDGKRFLRLDCADRPKLRAVYEEMGFVFHSHKQRSPYLVIRYEYCLDNLH